MPTAALPCRDAEAMPPMRRIFGTLTPETRRNAAFLQSTAGDVALRVKVECGEGTDYCEHAAIYCTTQPWNAQLLTVRSQIRHSSSRHMCFVPANSFHCLRSSFTSRTKIAEEAGIKIAASEENA